MLKSRVLFLCGANACRTQIAAAFLRDLAGDPFEALSAGYEPAEQISPYATAAMRELGIDISGQRPRKTDDLLGQPVALRNHGLRSREGAFLSDISGRSNAPGVAAQGFAAN